MNISRIFPMALILVIASACNINPNDIDAGNYACRGPDDCIAGYQCTGADSVIGVCYDPANPPDSVSNAPGHTEDDNTNTGLGTVEMALKYRAVSEGSGSPVSVSVYAGAATGAGHADSRGDMYNLGDGATSVVGGLGVGKLGFWSKGTWWAKANVQYHYRLALQTLDGQKVPADDIADDLEVGLQVHPRVGLAAGAHGFYRFGGYDIGSWPSELDSDLKWASLDAGALLAGGKALIYATDYTSVDIGVFKTVWAKNNPTDNLVASIGASVYFVP